MPNHDKHIAIICNPQAGNGKSLLTTDKIIRVLKQRAIKHSLFTALWPQYWTDITQAWIVGGDGTLNYFINRYPDLKLPLSIFKGGTGNDFQELMYQEISLEQQVEKILPGLVEPVDAGVCNDRLFLNGIGIGFDGAIVKSLLSKQKNWGKTAYLSSVLKNILFYKGTGHKIEFDDKVISHDCLMVNICNGKTEGGGFRVTPSANISDGKLDINIVGNIGSLRRLFYLPLIKKGNHLNLSRVQYYQSSKVEIVLSKPMPAHMDGEYFSSDRFFVECLPKRFSFLR